VRRSGGRSVGGGCVKRRKRAQKESRIKLGKTRQQLPISPMTAAGKQKLAQWAQAIMAKKQTGEDATEEENAVDNYIYKLFKLNKEKIATVEGFYARGNNL